MPARTSFAPGTPSWVDIGSPDLEVTNAFYAGVFGWERRDAGPPGETGGYGFYAKGDRIVAGYGPAVGPTVWWSTYISVADAAATVAEVVRRGGSVVAEPLEVPGHGTMAVCQDPYGAPFSLWQAGGLAGAELVDEAGALTWSELQTRDLPGALDFYTGVFGWTFDEGPQPGYQDLFLGEELVGGVHAIRPGLPARVVPQWNVWFGSDDVDEAATLVVELGGTVQGDPFDIPGVARVVVCGGPHREAFTIARMAG